MVMLNAVMLTVIAPLERQVDYFSTFDYALVVKTYDSMMLSSVACTINMLHCIIYCCKDMLQFAAMFLER
jgi:hypothetical protein